MASAPTEELLGPLNEIEAHHAPKTLWYEGDTSLLAHHPRVAVVGTRRPTEDGVRRARRLVRTLVEHRACVVSGLAEGIDTIAHTTAMGLGGRTIAVIGTPLDQAFPVKNTDASEADRASTSW